MILRTFKSSISVITAIILFFALFLHSCNEKPTDISYDMLYDTLSIIKHTSFEKAYFEGGESVFTPGNIFNAGAVLIGKYQETKSFHFMRFGNFPDTLSYLTPENVDSVVITMYPDRYALGDTNTNRLAFDVYQVDNYWSNQTDLDSIYEDPSGKPYITDRKVGNWEGVIELKDTMDNITFHLDKELFTEWLQLQPDTNAAVINWGIAFMPSENSTKIQLFKAYRSIDDPWETNLTAYYTNDQGESDTLRISAAINKSFASAPEPEENELIMQSGVRYNTRFQVDLTSLPDLSGIHYAKMKLHLNKEKSLYGNMGIDSLLSVNHDMDDESMISSMGYYDKEKNLYIFYDLVMQLEYILRHGKKGDIELDFSSFNEKTRHLDRYSFYGFDAADSTKLPVLEIIYSTRPDACK